MPEIIEIKKNLKKDVRKEVIIVKLKREGVQSKRESERESAEFRRDI